MGLSTNNEFMITELTSMLSENEILKYPVYGCLEPNYFGFFGLTNENLLFAILNPINGKKIDSYSKTPLNIKK